MAKGKEEECFESKLTYCISKPKDLQNALRWLGLPNKSDDCIIGAHSIEKTGYPHGLSNWGVYLGGCQN